MYAGMLVSTQMGTSYEMAGFTESKKEDSCLLAKSTSAPLQEEEGHFPTQGEGRKAAETCQETHL
jgi:hypothetical protein